MNNANNPEVLAVAGSAIALSRSIGVSDSEEPINTEHNQSWGPHLVKMTIFFDNVFRILAEQSGREILHRLRLASHVCQIGWGRRAAGVLLR